MECELTGEKKTGRADEEQWRDKLAKMVGRLRNSILPEDAKSFEEQLRWINARPGICDIKCLLEEAPKEDTLTSDECLLVRYLKDVKLKVEDLISKIEELGQSTNIKKNKSLWNSALEIGVSFVLFI